MIRALLVWVVSLIIVGILVLILVTRYFEIRSSNEGLFTDLTILEWIEEDILGSIRYPQTCPINDYLNAITRVHNDETSEVAIFVFTAKLKAKQRCKSTEISISRRSGEVWVTEIDSK